MVVYDNSPNMFDNWAFILKRSMGKLTYIIIY